MVRLENKALKFNLSYSRAAKLRCQRLWRAGAGKTCLVYTQATSLRLLELRVFKAKPPFHPHSGQHCPLAPWLYSTPSRSTAPLNTSLLWLGNFLRAFYLILNTLRTPWQIDFANKVFANYQDVWKITMDYIHILWLICIFKNAKHFA